MSADRESLVASRSEPPLHRTDVSWADWAARVGFGAVIVLVVGLMLYGPVVKPTDGPAKPVIVSGALQPR
jgi:cytochrome b561